MTNAQKIRDAIAQLKNHPELKPYLDTHTGKQTLAYVRERIADYLGQLGVETYQLAISQYQARVRQLGVEQKTTSVFVSTPGPDDNDNKRANIRTIESVKREFAQLGKILGTSTQSETLIEIINLAKLALSHQQKTVTSTGSTSHEASFDELTPVLEDPARPHHAPDENLETVEPNTTDDTVAAASHPTSSEQQANTVESLLLIEHNEELASIEEEVTEPVNPEPPVTIIDDNNTTSPQQSSTTQLTQTSEVNSNDLTVAITTLVNSMAVLTNRFDRFLERATTPVISNKDRNFSSSMREEEKNKNTNGQTSRRQRRKSAQASERIHDAINALINYNGRVGYEQRWYISAPVLKALAGGAQVTINEVMKNLKPLLDEHHQALGLGTQHNRSFHRGEQVTDFISLDF